MFVSNTVPVVTGVIFKFTLVVDFYIIIYMCICEYDYNRNFLPLQTLVHLIISNMYMARLLIYCL
jgi:hypothetical protein